MPDQVKGGNLPKAFVHGYWARSSVFAGIDVSLLTD
jgi:hypothetical protein